MTLSTNAANMSECFLSFTIIYFQNSTVYYFCPPVPPFSHFLSMIALLWSTIYRFRVPRKPQWYRQRASESPTKIWESPGDPDTTFYSSRETKTWEAWRNIQNWERTRGGARQKIKILLSGKMEAETVGSKQLRAGESRGERVGEPNFQSLNERK